MILDNFIKTYTQGPDDRGAEVVKGIGAACETETDFRFYSDLTSTVDEFSVEHTNPIDAYLGDEGVIATFGGELARDWYDVYIVQRVGEDTDIQIRELVGSLIERVEVCDVYVVDGEKKQDVRILFNFVGEIG